MDAPKKNISVFGQYPKEFIERCLEENIKVDSFDADLNNVVILRPIYNTLESIAVSPKLFDEGIHGKAWKIQEKKLKLSDNFVWWLKQIE